MHTREKDLRERIKTIGCHFGRNLRVKSGQIVVLMILILGVGAWFGVGVRAGVGKVQGGQVWDRLVKTLTTRQSANPAGQSDKKERSSKSESSQPTRDLPNAPPPTDLTVGMNNGVSRTGAMQGLIAFENTAAATVSLGTTLATRTQCRQLSRQGSISPFTMVGPDYTYQTDQNYS